MTRRDRLMILAVLSVVLLGGFWFLILAPQRKAASDAQAKVETARQELASAQQQLTAGQTAADEFRRDRTTILKLGRVVPETDDIPTLLTQLAALAKKNHVVFSKYSVDSTGAIAPTPTATTPDTGTDGNQTGNSSTDVVAPLFPPGSVQINGGLGRTPVKVELIGTYFSLEKYLRAVERFAVLASEHSSTTGRLMIVDGFNFTFSADNATSKVKNADSRDPRLTAALSASVYFAPPLDTPAASAGSGAGATTPNPTAAASTSTGTATIAGVR